MYEQSVGRLPVKRRDSDMQMKDTCVQNLYLSTYVPSEGTVECKRSYYNYRWLKYCIIFVAKKLECKEKVNNTNNSIIKIC